MSKKRPISEMLRSAIEVRDFSRTATVPPVIISRDQAAELLAIVEAAKETAAWLNPFCGQCGKPFAETACGPTHMLVAIKYSRLHAALEAAAEEPPL